MLKAIIIDDERHSREALYKKLSLHCENIVVLKMCSDAKEGNDAIRKYEPDVVFLDIEMPLVNGFGMLEQLKDCNFQVIFTTAYDHYAIQAIRFSAIDYLVKPIDVDELKAAVVKLKPKIDKEENAARFENLLLNLKPATQLKSLAITTANGLIFLNLQDILYLEASGNYTFIYATTQKILSSKTLREFEDILPENDFFRVHHSYLIQLSYLSEYRKGEGGEVVMRNGAILPVARRRKDELLEAVKRFSAKV
jgi:two-component system, LytTR family, response regulator